METKRLTHPLLYYSFSVEELVQKLKVKLLSVFTYYAEVSCFPATQPDKQFVLKGRSSPSLAPLSHMGQILMLSELELNCPRAKSRPTPTPLPTAKAAYSGCVKLARKLCRCVMLSATL